MSVGGRVIEIKPMTFEDGTKVVRLWCVDGTDETAVYCELFEGNEGPRIGENIWWQSGKIMFDGDRRTINKIGFSFDPRPRP